MKAIILSLIAFLVPLKFLAASGLNVEDSIKRLNWNGIDVIYIEDNRFPTFDLLVYFADGAISDDDRSKGLTNHAFNLLDAGTAKLSQKEILEQFEFFGAELSTEVTHEYTTLSMSGLTKDLDLTLTNACSLLREANYPKVKVSQEIQREKSDLLSLVSSPQSLADRVFRQYSLLQTPYHYPVNGKLADLDSYRAVALRAKLDYFLNKVKKRIYLTGPKSVLSVEKILAEKCKFKGSNKDFVRTITYKKQKRTNSEIVFVPVPDANQAYVYIGKFLNFDEVNDRRLDTLVSEFLGGGFTSKLMREVRVKRGLTYSISSYISSQKEYGRAGISTFTKNETVEKLVEVIADTIDQIAKNGISEEEFIKSRGSIIGSHPFNFESNRSFLSQLLYLDHVEKPYSELFLFNQAVMKYSIPDVAKRIDDVFSTKSQIIFILGDKSLEKQIESLSSRFGKVIKLDYKSFL